ncbi:MAG: GMC family oxidoreductase N-terminal domain-containing protein [Bdellovibrionota bacterium]
MAMEALNTRDAALLKSDLTEHYDYVIVGSGAGGAVAAKELAEGGAKVAILEEGAYHREHRDPAFQAIRRLYRDQGLTTTLGSPIIAVPTGRCFGGTTVINGGTCFRAPDSVRRNWHEKHGLTGLDAGILDSAYTRVEREIHVEPADFKYMSRSNTIMHELLAKQGYHGAALRRNIKECEGCGMCCYGCSSGAKQSMDVSYLPRALNAGAVAYTHARVTRVLKDPGENGAARGVVAQAINREGKPTGVTLTITADRTILAAGTLFTPQLLVESRIGRKNKHLGKHLSLHPATEIFAEFDEDINGWEGTPQAYYLDAFADEGIMFEGIFTPPDLVGLSTPFVGRQLIDFMKNYRKMTTFGLMIHDESEGRLIWLPLFGYTYYYALTAGDVKRIQRGIAFLARIFLKGGAKRVFPLVRGRHFNNLEDVDKFENSSLRAGDIDMMAFHPLGTCRMSTSAERGVVNQEHELYGTPNLFVCDGSVIPTSLGVNPQLTIMAFATRMASRMLGKPLS